MESVQLALPFGDTVPPEFHDGVSVLELFAGPGGWDLGAKIIGMPDRIHGFDVDRDACATATAAGFGRTLRDVTDLDPRDYPMVTGLIASPPCPTFSAAGKRTGLTDDAYQRVLDAITCLGSDCGHSWDEVAADLAVIEDPRTRLVAQVMRFALELPRLEWLACEQVPAVEYMWEDITAELYAAGWESADVLNLDAADYGVASRRARTFLIARRASPSGGSPLPGKRLPRITMAEALGWPQGERVNTRGQRRTSGGNEFSADGPAWCLTEKARSWRRVSSGEQLTEAEAGMLVGFPADYPWQGSRSKRFLQTADAVSPVVGAAVLGAVRGIEWERPVEQYLARTYSRRRLMTTVPSTAHLLSPADGLTRGAATSHHKDLRSARPTSFGSGRPARPIDPSMRR